MSIARRVLPSRLELNNRVGSGTLAPRANVCLTTFWYASPVQTIPLCDQTGLPHFHSSVISGAASRINARMRASVAPRHPPRSRIRSSMRRAAGGAFAPAFAGAFDLAEVLRLGAERAAGLVFFFMRLLLVIGLGVVGARLGLQREPE